jgi:hypothetical protein
MILPSFMTEREQPGDTVESIFWKRTSTLGGRLSGVVGGVCPTMLVESKTENVAGTMYMERMGRVSLRALDSQATV